MQPRTPIARKLRRQQSPVERKMWWLLRSRTLSGHKFYRQYAIGPYFADFCCRRLKLIIELDGSQHAGTQTYDQTRAKFLEKMGYKVLRFWNNEVIRHETL